MNPIHGKAFSNATTHHGRDKMEIKGLELRNFGPIESGFFKPGKINILWGPNNSGKSMFVRLINALSRPLTIGGTEGAYDYETGRLNEYYLARYGYHVARGEIEQFLMQRKLGLVSEELNDLITHGKKRSSITVHTSLGGIDMTLARGARNARLAITKGNQIIRRESTSEGRAKKSQTTGFPSIYVPAGRTGVLQYLYSIMYMRNTVTRDFLSAVGGPRQSQEMSADDLRQSLRALGRFPNYLEDFYELILESLATGIRAQVQDALNTLFTGSLKIEKQRGVPSLLFSDSTGFEIEMEWAGSGVVASVPVLLGLDNVMSGGVLMIEEPEAHLEPTKQMKLFEMLSLATMNKDVTLMVTTHSSYVVKKALAMVSSGKLENHDLALYYFERLPDKLTTMRRIDVDESGIAEQPLFQQANELLVGEYTENL